MKKLPATTILEQIKKKEYINYSSVEIVGELLLYELDEYKKDAYGFDFIDIEAELAFINCVVSDSLCCADYEEDLDEDTYCVFKKKIVFKNCIFHGKLYFTGSVFERGVSFENCQFRQSAYFQNAKFLDRAFFTQCIFLKWADFGSAEFSQKVDFEKSEMQKANFVETEFNGVVSFKNAVFHEEADFGMSQFKRTSDFSKIKFSGDIANFSYSIFLGDTDFRNSKFDCDTRFKGIQSTGLMRFENAYFYASADFMEAKFHGKGISFTKNHFAHIPFFDGASFSKKKDMQNIKKETNVNLELLIGFENADEDN